MESVDDLRMEGPIIMLELHELREVLEGSIKVLSREPTLIEREYERIIVVGDLHGTLEALELAKKLFEHGSYDAIAFLGDYVDRGPYQMEALYETLKLKMESPKEVIMLRGNHEDERMNYYYGFYDVLMRYPHEIRDLVFNVYKELPLAALISDRVFLVHGGISSGIENIRSIKSLEKKFSYDDTIMELLWNDPSDSIDYFSFNFMRGGYKIFGKKALEEFHKANEIEMTIRSHEYFPGGFVELWNGMLYTIHSSTAYGPVSIAVLDIEEERVERIPIKL